MSSTPTLNKHTALGFQLQPLEGTEVSDDILWVPFNSTLDFKIKTNRTQYRQADYSDYLHLLYSEGTWFEGGAPITLIPDATVITALHTWITARDSYNQGRFASVFMYDDARGIRAAMDVKVTEAMYRFEKGGLVGLELNLLGKKPGAASPAVNMPTARRTGPFLWKETAVTFDYGGVGALAATVDIESAEVRIDNHVEGAAEGMRITATSGQYPQKLYNIAGIDCTGSFSRDFLDSNVYDQFVLAAEDDFDTDTDGGIQFVMTRGGVTATLLVNRFQYIGDHGGDPSGSNEGRMVDSVEWQGLGNDAGTVAPLTLS